MYRKLFTNITGYAGLTGLICILVSPHFVEAQTFIPLISGLTPEPGDISGYLERVYILAISAAALLAVGKIILAGIKYTTSGVVTEKGDAKKDIQSALIGLLIILTAVAMLRVINPGLANLPALTPAGDLINWEVLSSCAVQQVSAIDGSVVCLSYNPGEKCDISQSLGFCGCNQKFVALSVEPGYTCVQITKDSNNTPDDKRGIVVDEKILSLLETSTKKVVAWVEFDNNSNTSLPGRYDTEVTSFSGNCRNTYGGTVSSVVTKNQEGGIYVIGCLVDKDAATE